MKGDAPMQSHGGDFLPLPTPIQRARKAAEVARSMPGPPHRDVDAALRVVLEHLRARYLDAETEDVPMIDFIEPLLKELG